MAAPSVWMPGAFAQLGPRLAHEFSSLSGPPIELAPFRPSGLLAQAILAGALTPSGEPFVRWLLGPIAQTRLSAAGFLSR